MNRLLSKIAFYSLCLLSCSKMQASTLNFEDHIASIEYAISFNHSAQIVISEADDTEDEFSWSGSANIIDVTSLGLPESLQGYVFSSCAHVFTPKDEITTIPGDVLMRLNLRIEPVPNQFTSDFDVYKIKALFYPHDYAYLGKGDVVFGILERPVENNITPVSLEKTELKDLIGRTITVCGYGKGGLQGSNTFIFDDVKRAGMQNVNNINIENSTFSIDHDPCKSSHNPLKEGLLRYVDGEEKGSLAYTLTKIASNMPCDNVNVLLRGTYKITTGFKKFDSIHDEGLALSKLQSSPEFRMEFENILNTGRGLIYVAPPRIPFQAEQGHSGGGALIWDDKDDKFKIVGITSTGSQFEHVTHSSVPRKKSDTLQDHLEKIKDVFENNKGETYFGPNVSNTYCLLWPYAERFEKIFTPMLLENGGIENISGVFKF